MTVALRAERCRVCSCNIAMKPEDQIDPQARCRNCTDVPGQYENYAQANANDDTLEGNGEAQHCASCGSTQFTLTETGARSWCSEAPEDGSDVYFGGINDMDWDYEETSSVTCDGCGRDVRSDITYDAG